MINRRQRRVRLPPEIEKWVLEEALTNERSENAQIVFALKLAMTKNTKAPGAMLGREAPDVS